MVTSTPMYISNEYYYNNNNDDDDDDNDNNILISFFSPLTLLLLWHVRSELNTVSEYSDILGYLWRPGPYVWPMTTIIANQSTLRYSYRHSHHHPDIKERTRRRECEFNMGLGAAFHMVNHIYDHLNLYM